MQSLLSREMPSGERSSPATFNVVLIYEDCETRERARKSLDYLGQEFGNDFEFRLTMWRLDVLQDPKLNALATPSLAEADLLIVSLRCERQVPDKIVALIDERLAQRVNPECALVAPFERSAPLTRSSVYGCLATLARRHGFDLFEQAISDAEDQAEPSLKLVWAFGLFRLPYADLLKRLRQIIKPNSSTRPNELSETIQLSRKNTRQPA